MNESQVDSVAIAAEHLTSKPERPGSSNTITYKWRNDAGGSMNVHVGVDEYGVLNMMIVNVGASGTQTHNLANSLGRVISIAIQNDKATATQIAHTLQDLTSEVVWMNDTLGRAKSIPGVIATILLRHIAIEEHLEGLHTELVE